MLTRHTSSAEATRSRDLTGGLTAKVLWKDGESLVVHLVRLLFLGVFVFSSIETGSSLVKATVKTIIIASYFEAFILTLRVSTGCAVPVLESRGVAGGQQVWSACCWALWGVVVSFGVG